MTWHAKPSGQYRYDSPEGIDNIIEISNTLQYEFGWTPEAVAGAVLNCLYEGQLNPWRWQGDVYKSAGCGIWGFTPSSKYLTTEGAQFMNHSTTEITAGASPIVGYYQTKITGNFSWGWVHWRDYWSVSQYPNEWSEWRRLCTVYGNPSAGKYGLISSDAFKRCTNLRDCVEIFYICYEGSSSNSLFARANDSRIDKIYEIITGHPPTPTIADWFLIPLLMLLKVLR